MPNPGRRPAALSLAEAKAISARGITVDFVVHPALLAELWGWLDSRGIDMIEGPDEGEGRRWFIASPRNLRQDR